jgi:beta-phosphoglucomutase
MMLKAVLFDMDGVLVDSEEFICKAAIEMFREKGLIVKPEDFIPFVGTGENRYIGGVAEKYNFPVDIQEVKKRTYEIYRTLVQNKLRPLPGVKEFINSCKDRKLKIAVATSADEVKMRINLMEIGLPVETFDTTVNGLQIERKKPFPDIYLKAAELLGVPPENCLVVEDAPSGIKAARAAGMKCLAVMSSFEEEELKGADWIVKDLALVLKKSYFESLGL